jgi:hypothetical protein
MTSPPGDASPWGYHLAWEAIFAAAFAWVENAVVIYLREILLQNTGDAVQYHPDDEGTAAAAQQPARLRPRRRFPWQPEHSRPV